MPTSELPKNQGFWPGKQAITRRLRELSGRSVSFALFGVLLALGKLFVA